MKYSSSTSKVMKAHNIKSACEEVSMANHNFFPMSNGYDSQNSNPTQALIMWSCLHGGGKLVFNNSRLDYGFKLVFYIIY